MTIMEFINKFNLDNAKVGIRVLPNERCKYMKGDELVYSSTNYRHCEIAYLDAKNDAIVFTITKIEAIRKGIVKGE